MNLEKVNDITLNKEITNGAKSVFVKYWEYVLEQYGLPFCQYCIKNLYAIYTHFTFFNVMLFLIKCVPPSIYMYKYIKNIYLTSRERMKLKQLELEELQLQIQIVKTKLSVREADFAERGELLRKKMEKFRKVRTRVREIIANDDELRNALNGNYLWEETNNPNVNNTFEEESKFMVELLKKLEYDQVVTPELNSEMLSCGEHIREPESPDNSVYTSASDTDAKQECHVKIVKVTNVYKVAYLRHFIKQKRLGRANKHALLKKKMDSIKKLLDDWQKALNMVINSKLSFLNNDSPQTEIASQEAMGDCSKSNYYNSSDSDSDIRNNDNFHSNDDYSMSWAQNQYKALYGYNYVDFTGDTVEAREHYDVRDYETYDCAKETQHCNKGVLYIVPEETKSQLEIKEIQSDVD